jgi:predicted TIM-barrel fold metal-dependent hydrolase
MVIDSHVHLFFEGSDPEEFFLGCARSGAAFFGKDKGEYIDAKQMYKQSLSVLSDKNGERIIKEMDKANIEKAILLPLDFWLRYPKSNNAGMISIEEKNKIYSNVVETYPDRLRTYFGIDPRRKDAVEQLHHAMKNWEPVGLKIHPTAGFFPDDPICFPLYEAAAEYDLPLLIHSGNEPAPMAVKYSHPMYIDNVAAEFPETKVIIAHCGHGWWRQAIDFASMKPNLSVDFSGWQLVFTQNPNYFWKPLRMAIDILGPWRVLFGTDGSMLDIILSPKKWVKGATTPSKSTEIPFSEREIEIFTSKAAKKLYNL